MINTHQSQFKTTYTHAVATKSDKNFALSDAKNKLTCCDAGYMSEQNLNETSVH